MTPTTKRKFWNVIWKIVEFILTLGLSHIAKRDKAERGDNANP